MEPTAEILELPPDYGRPKRRRTLPWTAVRERLESAKHYWLATVRQDGGPHVVPVDGLWVDDVWYFGGSSETVWHRNLASNAETAMHLEDSMRVVVVEGLATLDTPSLELAQRLSEASKQKYGYGPEPDLYTASGVWALRPRRVIAWTKLAEDTTRFRFS
jgi:nitroimidazol reductase NimA-like FMN-containing flavoprotein (pyridoxamine 5'-phosphate oxidase superfamily)